MLSVVFPVRAATDSHDENLEAKPGRRRSGQGGTLCQGGSYEQFVIERSRMVTASWRESPCPWYGSSVPVKVVRSTNKRFAQGFLLAAPPLTVLAEPRDVRLGFRAGTCGQTLKPFPAAKRGFRIQCGFSATKAFNLISHLIRAEQVAFALAIVPAVVKNGILS